ncbi:hypothetical protein TNCV_3577471 [Trichonephila clavipes]|uniref:Uncharacterized protein n=1 Tax=Trichonephila clavipes TaxID=2585209 RepID=A0A8X6RMG9_TRICX|nr:hypothetical protein TNCV_3577471 [Trichonephila clavipes]
MNNRAVELNGILHANDYEERLVTRYLEVLPTNIHSALEKVAVAKILGKDIAKCLPIHSGRHREVFDHVNEFHRGKIVAYRDCGLSFREIYLRVGQNQAIVMRICHHWMSPCGRGSLVVEVSNRGWLVTSSSSVPLNTHHVGERCPLNLSRAQTSFRWCGSWERGRQLRFRPRHLTMVQNYEVRHQKPSCSWTVLH